MNILSIKYLLYVLCSYFLYWLVSTKARKYVLLCSSILFLLSFGIIESILVILYSILTYYLSNKCINKKTLIISIVILLIPLFYNKYIDSIIGFLGTSESMNRISIIGISFLSFKAISYLIDNYEKKYAVSIIDFMIYMLFFPVFLSGPIERIKNFGEEINNEKQINWDCFISSLFKVFYGMFIKMTIADRLIRIINYMYSKADQYSVYTIVAILAYSIYIYADFAGYSYIARGVSELFAIKVNDNFRQPYYSYSIKEFWNRWHISLNEWLKDYIYIPLGGNRNGRYRKYLNILIVFFISGIWHGAGFGFIVWGLLNGIFQIIGELTQDVRNNLYNNVGIINSNTQKVIKVVFVFLLISFTWVFFAQGFNGAITIISSLFKPRQFGVIEFALNLCGETETSKQELIILFVSVLLMCIVDYFVRYGFNPLGRIMSSSIVVRFFALLVLMLMVVAFGKYGHGVDMENFVYFKF